MARTTKAGRVCNQTIFYFFWSLYAFPPKGALGYEAVATPSMSYVMHYHVDLRCIVQYMRPCQCICLIYACMLTHTLPQKKGEKIPVVIPGMIYIRTGEGLLAWWTDTACLTRYIYKLVLIGTYRIVGYSWVRTSHSLRLHRCIGRPPWEMEDSHEVIYLYRYLGPCPITGSIGIIEFVLVPTVNNKNRPVFVRLVLKYPSCSRPIEPYSTSHRPVNCCTLQHATVMVYNW